MQAEISRSGYLIITAENPTEEYALRKWTEDNYIKQQDLQRNEQGHWRGSFVQFWSNFTNRPIT